MPVILDISVEDISSSVAILAQREDIGSKSATMVRAIVPASGNVTGVTYSRIANMAVRS